MILIKGAKKGYLIKYVADGLSTYLDEIDDGEKPYTGGSAAKFFGIDGEYSRKKLLMSLEGYFKINGKGKYVDVQYHNSGKKNENGKNRELDAAIEMIISVPKSWSIASYYARPGSSAKKKIDDIIRQSKLDVMAEVERSAKTRVTRNGVTTSEDVKGIVWTGFDHNTTRYGDMDNHTHIIIQRHAVHTDGVVRTIDLGSLIYTNYELDAIMKTSLARNAAAQGVKLRDGVHGPELAAVSDEVVEVFSEGLKQIDAYLEKQGVNYDEASYALKNQVNLKIRPVKMQTTEDHLGKLYTSKLKEVGIDEDELVKGIKFSRAYPVTVEVSSIKAIDLALQGFYERNDIINSRHKLIYEAARQSQFKIGIPQLNITLDELIKSGEIILRSPQPEGARSTAGGLKLTTRYAVEREQKAVEMYRSQRSFGQVVCTIEDAQAAIKKVESGITDSVRRSNPDAAEIKLTKGQVDMVHTALGLLHRNNFSVIEGDPGTGKKTGMQAVKIAAVEAGWKVRGLAPSDNAREALSSSGIQTETVQLAVKNQKFWDDFDSQTILIMDEAGMVDSETYNQISEKCAKLGVRFIAVGDSKQLQAVEAGTPFSRAAAEARRDGTLVHLDQMTRGRTLEMRELHDLSRDDQSLAIERLMQGGSAGRMVFLAQRDDQIEYVSQKLAAMAPSERVRHPVIVDRNADAYAINKRIRELTRQKTAFTVKSFAADQRLTRIELLLASNYERGQMVKIMRSDNKLKKGDVYEVKGQSEGQVELMDHNGAILKIPAKLFGAQASIGTEQEVGIGEGDLIRVVAKWDKGDLKTKTDIRNGDRALVRSIDGEGWAQLDIVNFDGKVTRQAEVDFSRKGISIRHGYSSTVHGVQGASIESGTYLASNTSKNSFMVGITRFRNQVDIVAGATSQTRLEQLIKSAQKAQYKEPAMPPSVAQDRQRMAVNVHGAWPRLQAGESLKSTRPLTPYPRQSPLDVDTMHKFLMQAQAEHGEQITITGGQRFLALAQRTAKEQNMGQGIVFKGLITEGQDQSHIDQHETPAAESYSRQRM